MKCNININQPVLAQTELDIKDGAILDYLIFYCGLQQHEEEDGYSLLNLERLVKDMPLLNIKRSNSLLPRLQKIEANGFIKTKKFSHRKKIGIKLTSAINKLFVSEVKINKVKPKPPKKIVDPDYKEINEILNLFKSVNPTLNFGHMGYRIAIKKLISTFGFSKTIETVKFALAIQNKPYAPVITTPSQLKNKLGNLRVYWQREKNKVDKNKIIFG